jgi:hypothetical protein
MFTRTNPHRTRQSGHFLTHGALKGYDFISLFTTTNPHTHVYVCVWMEAGVDGRQKHTRTTIHRMARSSLCFSHVTLLPLVYISVAILMQSIYHDNAQPLILSLSYVLNFSYQSTVEKNNRNVIMSNLFTPQQSQILSAVRGRC